MNSLTWIYLQHSGFQMKRVLYITEIEMQHTSVRIKFSFCLLYKCVFFWFSGFRFPLVHFKFLESRIKSINLLSFHMLHFSQAFFFLYYTYNYQEFTWNLQNLPENRNGFLQNTLSRRTTKPLLLVLFLSVTISSRLKW